MKVWVGNSANDLPCAAMSATGDTSSWSWSGRQQQQVMLCHELKLKPAEADETGTSIRECKDGPLLGRYISVEITCQEATAAAAAAASNNETPRVVSGTTAISVWATAVSGQATTVSNEATAAPAARITAALSSPSEEHRKLSYCLEDVGAVPGVSVYGKVLFMHSIVLHALVTWLCSVRQAVHAWGSAGFCSQTGPPHMGRYTELGHGVIASFFFSFLKVGL